MAKQVIKYSSAKVDSRVMAKVRKHVKKHGQTISGFFLLAATDRMFKDDVALEQSKWQYHSPEPDETLNDPKELLRRIDATKSNIKQPIK